MVLSTLTKTTHTKKKRVGRGYGSGKGGHTVGRGAKGQKARNEIPIDFIGTARGSGYIKRFPYLRGKGKHKAYTQQILVVPTSALLRFKANEKVTVEALVSKHIVSKQDIQKGLILKILYDSALDKKLAVYCKTSKSAKKAIEEAGGTVNSTTIRQASAKISKQK
jgi:large subunit ribosomal protein L15